MTPLRQGELDMLCGYYAVLNAIRLCSPKGKRLTTGHLTSLFRELTRHQNESFATQARVGMFEEEVQTALRHAIRLCRQRHKLVFGFTKRTFRSLAGIQRGVEQHLARPERAVIIAVDRHSTVVEAVHGPLWGLHDSYRYKFLLCQPEGVAVCRQKPLLKACPGFTAFFVRFGEA